jgi:hypothetical protein
VDQSLGGEIPGQHGECQRHPTDRGRHARQPAGQAGQQDRDEGCTQRKQQPRAVPGDGQYDENQGREDAQRGDSTQARNRQAGDRLVGDPGGGSAQDQQNEQNQSGEPAVGLAKADRQRGDAGLALLQQGGRRPSQQQRGAGQQREQGDGQPDRLDAGRPRRLVGEAQDQDDQDRGEIGHHGGNRDETREHAEIA